MVKIPEQNEFYLGELFYFFEFACGVSEMCIRDRFVYIRLCLMQKIMSSENKL